jgi:hypothetical protein
VNQEYDFVMTHFCSLRFHSLQVTRRMPVVESKELNK